MSVLRRVRASSLGPEARLGRARSPVQFGAGFNSVSSTGGAMHPGEEKETMRGLNERLAGYLSQVRLLEEANSKLEAQIKQVLTERRAAGQRDWSGYEKTISTLRDQMKEMTMDNARLMLQIDNARLAADDFKVKLEAEINVHQGVEQDITSLRKMIDDTHMSHMKLESEVESLTEELIYMKKSHEEDVANVKDQIRDASVDVQMEAAKGQDLSETIDKIRKQYEKAAQKSCEETQAWYQAKFKNISAEVSRNTDALQQGQSELNDLRRQKQGLEIDLQAMHSMNRSLEDTLNDTMGHYSQNVNNHNTVIQQLEAELAEVHAQVTRKGAEYEALLNIKSKLEEEIATYHSLLEGTGMPSNGVTDSGLPENVDFRGMGAREVITIQDIGPSEDANIGGNSLGGCDESVDFSLEQALSAGPRFLIPEPTLNDEIIEEEEMIAQKDLELNAANTAMNKQHDLKEAGQGMDEDPDILEEMEKEEETVNFVVKNQVVKKEEEEETVSPVEDTVLAKKKEEMVSPVLDTQVEKVEAVSPIMDTKVEEAVSPVVDTKVEKVEEAASLIMDTHVEKVEEAASPIMDTHLEKVEEAVRPMVDTQVEMLEQAASSMLDTLAEKVDEAVSPVVDTRVEKVDEAASPMVDTQVERLEEAASPMVDNQVEKVEEAVSPVLDSQVEKVDEAVSPGVDTHVEKVEDSVSPVVDMQVEKVEKAVSPMVDPQVEKAVSPIVDTQVEEAVSPVVSTQAEKAVSPVVDTQVEKVEEAASPMVDTQVEKVEEAGSPMVDTQVEKVEEAGSPMVDTQVEKVEEAGSPMVDTRVEKVEEAGSPMVDTRVEKVEEAGSPMVDTQVKKAEAASPVVDTQVEEAASPVVYTQVKEDMELKSTTENINAEEKKQEGEEPENPEAEQNMEE